MTKIEKVKEQLLEIAIGNGLDEDTELVVISAVLFCLLGSLSDGSYRELVELIANFSEKQLKKASENRRIHFFSNEL